MKRGSVLAAALAIVLVACGSNGSGGRANPSPSTSRPKITNVVLVTHSSFAVSKDVLNAFTAATGYKVTIRQVGDAGALVNQAILRKDHPIGDALFGVDNTFLTRTLDAGIFDPYVAHGLDTVPPALQPDAQHRVTPVDTANVCVIYDKAYFGKSGHPAPPVSLADLVQPAYKKLTEVENASTSSPGLAFLLATIAAEGAGGWQQYWRDLRANGVRVVDDWSQAYDTDFTAGGGGGDRPIVVSYGSDPAADIVFSKPHRDTPNVGVMASTCFRQAEYAGVLHGAHNPEGAQALIDFFLTLPFQQDMPLQTYVNPVVTGAQLPAVFKQWAVAPPHPFEMDPATIAAHRDEWIKEWTDIAVR